MTNVSRAEYFEAVGAGIGVLVLQAVILWLIRAIRKESMLTGVLGPVPLNPKNDPELIPLSSEEPVKDERWILPADAKPSEVLERLDDVLQNANGVPCIVPGDFVRALMNVISTMDVAWTGDVLNKEPSEDPSTSITSEPSSSRKLSSGIQVPSWSKRMIKERIGSFDGFSADSPMVLLNYFWIKHVETWKYVVRATDKSLTFIPAMMIRAFQRCPDRSNEIRARAIFVWNRDALVFNPKFYSLVLFPTANDFQDMLKDIIKYPLMDIEDVKTKISGSPALDSSKVAIIDYKCTRGENDDIVLEALRWDKEKIDSVLAVSE